MLGFAAGLVGLLSAIYGLTGGPPWPTTPDIEAHDTTNGSPDILPFIITNRSGLFPIRSIDLVCYNDLIYAMDAKRQTILLRDTAFFDGASEMAGRLNYSCAAAHLSVGDNGALAIGFPSGQILVTKPGLFYNPITILKMCIMVSGSYKTALGSEKFQSTMFQWPAMPGDYQWITGPIAFDGSQEKWIPPNSIPAEVLATRQMTIPNPNGAFSYAPGALLCDKPQ